MPKDSSKKSKKRNTNPEIIVEEGSFDFAPKRGAMGTTATMVNTYCCTNAAGTAGLIVGGSIWAASRIGPNFLKSLEDTIGTIPTALITILTPSAVPAVLACLLYCCCGCLITLCCVNSKNNHKLGNNGYSKLKTPDDKKPITASTGPTDYQTFTQEDSDTKDLSPNLAKVIDALNELEQDLILTIFNRDGEGLQYKDVILGKLNEIINIKDCTDEAVAAIHQNCCPTLFASTQCRIHTVSMNFF